MDIYIDCTNGISTDMVLNALIDLGADEKIIEEQINALGDLPHHRGYKDIKKMLETSSADEEVKKKALLVYGAIARAEAEVHGETLDTVHFHEVGRDEAIRNIVSVAAALKVLGVDKIYCSEIHDGHGTIKCSHGIIPVPVPAVTALKKQCDHVFCEDDINTEMVTPGGLALLIGIGAVKSDPPKKIIKTGVGKGTRDIGRDGLKIHSIGCCKN
ncbi:MAG: nickel insertion protein [Eubacteriaceae bacterium]|nr:nickel insertion protein [Eubacteriaceae bacterium]